MKKKIKHNPPQCRSCGGPQAQKYSPHEWPKALQTEEIAFGNWIHLERCVWCDALWFVARDAGHASQSYLVRWPFTVDDWEWLNALEGGKALRDWHDGQFRTPPAPLSDLEQLLRGRSAPSS